MDRREWMGSVLGMSVAAGLAEAAPTKSSAKEITADGRYPVVPLERESIRIGLVQTRFRSIDPDNVERSRKENLAYMLDWIDRAQQGSRHDVLMFHELPLTGLSMTWNRATILKGCIEIPGVETEAIAQKARQHRCYVIFGAYVVDRAWPGHFVSATTMIGPQRIFVSGMKISPFDQRPSPRLRPKPQSMPPSLRATPETC